MLAATDGSGPSNGTFRVVSNGSRATEALAMSASNGTHKSTESANGSSQNGKQEELVRQTTYLGHDREEVTRILIQALADMGYRSAAESVSRDSGYQLESPTVGAFRKAVLEGVWSRAEELLSGAVPDGERPQAGNGLVLAPETDSNIMRIWIRQQKFLELLERRETARALLVLRTELSPLCQEQNGNKLQFLSSLLMESPEELKQKAGWDGAYGDSRRVLLAELSGCMSPSVMLPDHRLAALLQQVKENQVNECLFHTSAAQPSLYADHVCDRAHFPSDLLFELDNHAKEVWQVRFSHNGTRLASCGADPFILIFDVPSFEILYKLEGHEGGVGNLAWSPDDSLIVSCGVDRFAKVWDVKRGECIQVLERFSEPVSCCAWVTDEEFILGSFDLDKALCLWDLDGRRLFTLTKKHRTEDLAFAPDGSRLVAMDDQRHLHVYNFVARELEYEMELKSRPTSISITRDSRFMLINKIDGEGQLIDMNTREPTQKYSGAAAGGQCIIRSSIGGASESFIISGSEDGSVCIWHKVSGIPIVKFEAHQPRCNSACWNPVDPCIFATCGDDSKVKIWSNKERVRSLNSTYRARHSNGAGQRSTSSNGLETDPR